MHRFKFEFLIFISGAMVLAMEVLASRIMTPFFGVSLYIWAAILSTTLIFLAFGYFLGGLLCQRHGKDSLEVFFLGAPLASALVTIVGNSIYPVIFPSLLHLDLILGSLIGGIILLSVPLVLLSAMNPLLIAIGRSQEEVGDGGAGRVFFISTLGSVSGVALTAFAIVPNMTNHRALLVLSAALCVVTLVVTVLSLTLERRRKSQLVAFGIVVSVVATGLYWWEAPFLDLLSKISAGENKTGLQFRTKAEYTSYFGNVKIVEVSGEKLGNKPHWMFIHDGVLQNSALPDGLSMTPHTYLLEKLGRGFEPEARDVLVLGLGAGIVPRNLKRLGLNVTVVEINPVVIDIARKFFHYSSEGIMEHIEDARTYVRKCRNEFDLVIMDLFYGDNTPDYLLSTEFFADVKSCLKETGTMVANTVVPYRDSVPYRHILATVGTAFSEILDFQEPDLSNSGFSNVYFVATNDPFPDPVEHTLSDIPSILTVSIRYALESARYVSPTLYSGINPVSDRQNIFSVINAESHMRLRLENARHLPINILIN